MTAKSVSKICSIQGCDSQILARRFCSIHYKRLITHGDPLKTLSYFGSGKTREEKFWSKVAVTPDITQCWEWLGAKNKDGYGQTRFHGSLGSHRLAWFFTYGEWPTNILRHACDKPPCCNPNHLIDGTHAENAHDRDSRGRAAIGEKSGRAKLTESQVVEIRSRCLLNGRSNRGQNSQLALAKEFNVGRSTIRAIITRTSWRCLPSV